MIDCCAYIFLLVVFTKVFMEMKEVISLVTMEDVDFGLKIPLTLTFTIVDKVLVVMAEVHICIRPAPLPPIIQVSLIANLVFLFVVMIELDIGLIPDIILRITILDYNFSTQRSLKNIFQGVWEEVIFGTFVKDGSYIHIKIILIILIQSSHHTIIELCHHKLIQTCHHTLIQEFHHTLFISVHIVLLLLFMNLV